MRLCNTKKVILLGHRGLACFNFYENYKVKVAEFNLTGSIKPESGVRKPCREAKVC